MNQQQLISANIENLTQLWKRMGTTPHIMDNAGSLFYSDNWPHRCWFESKLNRYEASTITKFIEQIKNHYILPVWLQPGIPMSDLEERLRNNGFEMVLQQTAMVLEMKNYQQQAASEFNIIEVNSTSDIDIWTDIAARAFSYEINSDVIRTIVDMPEVQLLLAVINNHPVATALIFNTGNVVGVHQVGVLEQFRGQGIARKLMHHVINQCATLPARYVTLQASVTGAVLYKSLGFKPQFKIKSYQRRN